MKLAATPLPSAIPPAAITGIETASTTWGTSVIVVASPMCPPDSVPSAITASAPHCCILFARATPATTGTTMMPASFHISIYFSGEPAPVVTTFTFSSAITFAISGALGFMSIRFTPNGLSVASRHFLIWSRSQFSSAPPTPMMPRPPASDTAAAMCQSATHAIPPWKIGYLIPTKSVILVILILLCRYL